MNDESYELLRTLYHEEWLDYRVALSEAVYEREGMGLFELHRAGRVEAVAEALGGGLMFLEWVKATKTTKSERKRL